MADDRLPHLVIWVNGPNLTWSCVLYCALCGLIQGAPYANINTIMNK